MGSTLNSRNRITQHSLICDNCQSFNEAVN